MCRLVCPLTIVHVSLVQENIGRTALPCTSLADSADYRPDAGRLEQKTPTRDYFQLDKLYNADADTWTKALSIGKFVASNIPHNNQKIQPEHRNAIDLWEYTKCIEPAFNCRLHSILTFELMLAAGLDARLTGR